MTKQDFINAYTALDIDVRTWSSIHNRKRRGIPLETEKEIKRDYLELEWLSGGMEGGNCWGDEADTPVDSEPEPAFKDLDVLLEAVAPRMTFLLYKKLFRDIVKEDSREDCQYYGNYYMYNTKRVYLDDLYDWLKNNGVLTEQYAVGFLNPPKF